MRVLCLFVVSALFFSVTAGGQTTDYDALVQKGKAQLQAGSADLALASGEAAIKMNADRWEGYALAGGALMNLKRYEEAADKFSHAIDRAPEAKQTALRDLRRQSLLAESGPSPSPKEAVPTTSQAEIVLWKSIENSNNPDDFNAYLEQYPNGTFAGLATQHLEKAKQMGEEQDSRRKQADLRLADLRNSVKPYTKGKGTEEYSFKDPIGCSLEIHLHVVISRKGGDNDDVMCRMVLPLDRLKLQPIVTKYKEDGQKMELWEIEVMQTGGQIAQSCSGTRHEQRGYFDPRWTDVKKDFSETNNFKSVRMFSFRTAEAANEVIGKLKVLVPTCNN
jgi:tetratricopeptide (TPR) repeat protein